MTETRQSPLFGSNSEHSMKASFMRVIVLFSIYKYYCSFLRVLREDLIVRHCVDEGEASRLVRIHVVSRVEIPVSFTFPTIIVHFFTMYSRVLGICEINAVYRMLPARIQIYSLSQFNAQGTSTDTRVSLQLFAFVGLSQKKNKTNYDFFCTGRNAFTELRALKKIFCRSPGRIVQTLKFTAAFCIC